MKGRVFLVEDHDLVREGIARIIADSPDFVVAGQSPFGNDAIQFARDADWDVLVVDLSLPDVAGLDVIERIRKVRPSLPILVLTMHADVEYAHRAIRAGATGYVTKGISSAELLIALRAQLAGKRYFSAEIAEKLLEHLERPNTDGNLENLSQRERQVFAKLVEGKSNDQIASELNLAASTVSHYKKNLMAKLNAKSIVDLVRIGHG